MNKDMFVGTLPIKPQKNTNVGMLIGPVIMDFIGDVLDINKNMGINILHTYLDKELEMDEYLSYINLSGVSYDDLFVDKYYADSLLEIVNNMYENGDIVVKNKEILRCNCGMIDMIDCNNTRLGFIKDGDVYCKVCGSRCKRYKEDVLVYQIKEMINDFSIVPLFLNKELESFQKQFIGKDILVSKLRNTGYRLGKYNIDIDFLWSNYFKLYDYNRQIYIASNHQLFNMYLMSNIASNSGKKLTFIASPYLNVDMKKAKEEIELKSLREYKKLLILYNLKWKNKNNNWDDGVYKYLSNISNTKLQNLYKAMLIRGKSYNINSLEDNIYNILNRASNMQEGIKVMKRLYKDNIL